jgi:N-acetylglucosamine kinase-like BadF-type ATPase
MGDAVGRSLFVGVDGGGSKTRFVLIDGDGNRVAACEGPTSYHLEVGMDGVRAVLADGLAALLRGAGIAGGDVTHAFLGLPAHGEDAAAQAMLDAMPAALLGHRRYRCGNDVVCAFAGALGGADGIVIVAGTGSIAYGEHRGCTARAGGWGEVFGDEGSAYWIAVRGLNAFSRMSDGRLPRGPLHAIFQAELEALPFGADAGNSPPPQSRSDLELCAPIMSAAGRSRIAALSPLVARAAQSGDVAARGILDEAARELTAIAGAVHRALNASSDEPVALSWSGGVFNAGDLILDPLRRHLAAQGARYRLAPPLLPPGEGAAVYAARLAGAPLTSQALTRLTRSQ